MQLVVNGLSIPVAQMGPDFLLLDTPVDCPPGLARIILEVDESKRDWAVRLPNGISRRSARVAIALPEPLRSGAVISRRS